MAQQAQTDQWSERFTPELLEQYNRDGVVHIPQLLHPEWIDLIAMGIQRIVAGPSRKSRFYKDDPGEFIDTTRNFDSTPEFRRLCYDSPIADMLGLLIGSERVWLLFDHVFVKDRPESRRTPWHQDLIYWPIEGRQVSSFWIPLNPLPKDQCLEFIKGSHLGPLYDGFDPTRVLEGDAIPLYDDPAHPPLPDIETQRDQWDIVSWDIEPGDVIAFHPGVLHGGGPTRDGNKRRSLSIRCFGENEVYTSRPGDRPTAPRTPGLSLRLKPGDPLRDPYYPRLRPLPEHQQPENWM